MSEYDITVTLTVGFGIEADEEPDETEAEELFLEWLGSASDTWILEGVEIEIEKRKGF